LKLLKREVYNYNGVWLIMEKIEIQKEGLVTLLKRTQRMANINGKMIPQVKGTILYIENDKVRTFNIVRDGTSSISSFCEHIHSKDEEGRIPVADISLLLGALSKHSGLITLTRKDNKIKIQSASKQTTLQSSSQAQAFAHTKQTIAEWCEDSRRRYEHTMMLNPDCYTLANGEVVKPALSITLNSDFLCSAIESGSMNGQKIENYTFSTMKVGSNNCLILTVGAEGRGKTETLLQENVFLGNTATIAGGLDNVLRTVKGDVTLLFFDLTPYGGGMSLRLSFAGGCIFQRESVNAAN